MSSEVSQLQTGTLKKRNTWSYGDSGNGDSIGEQPQGNVESATPSVDLPEASIMLRQFTFVNQIRATIFRSWVNILLVAVPTGIALHAANGPSQAIFAVNFIAIIPLAALLSQATEEISLRIGETYGGLLNATFGFELNLRFLVRSADSLFLVTLLS
jgi:Ca2+:H+ antiporter